MAGKEIKKKKTRGEELLSSQTYTSQVARGGRIVYLFRVGRCPAAAGGETALLKRKMHMHGFSTTPDLPVNSSQP
jgi:hypothetical protein